jgi:hypothetical protein
MTFPRRHLHQELGTVFDRRRGEDEVGGETKTSLYIWGVELRRIDDDAAKRGLACDGVRVVRRIHAGTSITRMGTNVPDREDASQD